jgi:hypothetical protein
MPAFLTKMSVLTGKERTLKFPQYEQDEFDNLLKAYREGILTLDEAFVKASPFARSFIRDGTTPEENGA